jgi:hypothetical protein
MRYLIPRVRYLFLTLAEYPRIDFGCIIQGPGDGGLFRQHRTLHRRNRPPPPSPASHTRNRMQTPKIKIIQDVSKIALQWYYKCYCVVSVSNAFTLQGVQGAQVVERWIVCTPVSLKP